MRNLDELFEAMRAGKVDPDTWDNLPTWGPDYTRDTLLVWSWDETREIYGTSKGDIRIQSRRDGGYGI